MSSSKDFAVGISLVALVVFAAAFMPWGTVRAPSRLQPAIGDGELFGDELFGSMHLTFTMNGWAGSLSVGDVDLPNWLVVLAAAGVAALAWLGTLGIWTAPALVPFALAVYGLFHASMSIWVLTSSDQGTTGIGSFVTAAAFLGLLVLLIRQVRTPQHQEPHPDPSSSHGPA